MTPAEELGVFIAVLVWWLSLLALVFTVPVEARFLVLVVFLWVTVIVVVPLVYHFVRGRKARIVKVAFRPVLFSARIYA